MIEGKDEEPSLRDTLSDPFDQAESGTPDEGTEPKDGQIPAAEGKLADVADEGAGGEVKKDVADATIPPKDKPAKAARGSGAKGKVVDPAAVDGKDAEGKDKGETIPSKRPPGSWTPAMREKWNTLPPDVQTYIHRREREISTGFNEIKAVKTWRDQFLNTVNPYQQVFTAEGGDVLGTVNNLLKTANVLYGGSQSQKVMAVATIIKNFGVDLPMLDAALAGQAPTDGGSNAGGGDANSIQAIIQRELQTALGPILRGQQSNDAQMDRDAESEIETFATDPKNEFFDDVKDTMADLLELAAKRSQKMDLSTAYNRAILMHSDIADIVNQRKVQDAARKTSEAAAAARRRAGGISGSRDVSPAGTNNETTTLRQDLEAAFDATGT